MRINRLFILNFLYFNIQTNSKSQHTFTHAHTLNNIGYSLDLCMSYILYVHECTRSYTEN